MFSSLSALALGRSGARLTLQSPVYETLLASGAMMYVSHGIPAM